MPNTNWLYLTGALLLLLFAPLATSWAEPYVYRILLAGPLVFVPWAAILFPKLRSGLPKQITTLYFINVLLLIAAFCLPAGLLATAMSGTWLLFTIYLLAAILRKSAQQNLGILIALCSLPVAAAWMLADRLGFQPLGFDPLIVLLTGVHFHYAGFALAIMAAHLPNNPLNRWLSFGMITGLAGVAAGITSTQLDGPAWIEILGVSIMVTVGIGIAIQQLRYAWGSKRPILAQLLLSLGALALIAGMGLALLYGWRFHYQWSWLNVPCMYATHGLLNSLGFSLLSFLGYSLRNGNENRN